ncbi:TasA family protein [Halorientalis litorea]|uniref:TasA family protein n=1 Tax=Halorientalis litorea TaxID=2931977 RepID=UPI001FF615BA|nr:TasA family protein [Halorientalis litorea]
MGSGDITLTRRRLLGGVATVGVTGAGVGAGTAALYSDTETSASNGLSAGTLNLTLDGQDTTVQFLSETGIAPGDSGTATMTVANAGSVTGYVDVEVASVTNAENGCAGNENSVDNSCGDPGQGLGELQDNLETEAYFQNGPTLWGPTTVAAEPNAGDVYDVDYALSGGASDQFVLDWSLPAGTGNEAQTDSVSIQLTFRLDQEVDAGL